MWMCSKVLLALILLGQGQAQSSFSAPSPNAIGSGGWEAALQKANAFVAQLNLTEKTGMVTGTLTASCSGIISAIPRLNFTGLCLQDGPLGIRMADLASVFPAGVTVGASWDKSLMYARGFAIGQEFKGKGSQVILGPVAGPIGRHPLGGRNWEGFSSDPYLAGIAMQITIGGIQDAGVQACAKHFIGNEQETQRSSTLVNGTEIAAISSNIDDRTMHELYLWPFADAVKAGVSSIMCSYNRLNETYACENSKLLDGLLKGELGFQGYVMSDWFATHSGVKSINAGLDMDMPGVLDEATARASASLLNLGGLPSFFGSNITTAINNGTVKESRLDDMIRRIMTPFYFLGQDQNFPTIDPSEVSLGYVANGLSFNTGSSPPARDVRDSHASIIRALGSAGIVLLKNSNATLPIQKVSNIAVFGNDAADVTDGLYFLGYGNQPFGPNIGTIPVGGGSGAGRATYVVSPLAALRQKADTAGIRLQYITNNDIISLKEFTSIYPTPDVCLVFLKTWAVEGSDRVSFENDWNSTVVVENVASICPKTVVVTHSSGVNTMPWAENPNVAAILAAHYPGQESGNAIVDVLFGDVNPSGHLPYTIPRNESDYDIPIVNLTGPVATSYNSWQSNFSEGLLIDYRHFDANNITPLYEFGFGLSYTTFNLSTSLSIGQSGMVSALPAKQIKVSPGGNPDLWTTILTITVVISNTGSVAGATVPQLYVSLPVGTGSGSAPAGTPVQVLRGFEKIYLQPGESKPISFGLARRDVSYWSVEEQEWRIPNGGIGLKVGFSSRDIKASTVVTLLS